MTVIVAFTLTKLLIISFKTSSFVELTITNVRQADTSLVGARELAHGTRRICFLSGSS